MPRPSAFYRSEPLSALKAAQEVLAAKQLSLIVWDCYRPVQAVRDFLRWAADSSASQMKQEFFSGDEQGPFIPTWIPGEPFKTLARQHRRFGDHAELASGAPDLRSQATLVPCTEAQGVRFEDGTIDLGTGHDCLDVLVNVNGESSGASGAGQSALSQRHHAIRRIQALR